MSRYSLQAIMFDGDPIEVKGPLTSLQAYDKTVDMQKSGMHSITLTNLETGEQIEDVGKLIPYPGQL